MGHMHSHHHHHHGHGSSSSLPFRKPRKETKTAALVGLQLSNGDPARELQAIQPLQLESPALHAQMEKLVQAGNGARAVKLLEMCPTRMSSSVLAMIVIGPILVAGLIVSLVTTLGR